MGSAFDITTIDPTDYAATSGVAQDAYDRAFAIPAGADGQVQYNNGGVIGADSGLAYNGATGSLAISGTLGVGAAAGVNIAGNFARGFNDSIGPGNRYAILSTVSGTAYGTGAAGTFAGYFDNQNSTDTGNTLPWCVGLQGRVFKTGSGEITNISALRFTLNLPSGTNATTKGLEVLGQSLAACSGTSYGAYVSGAFTYGYYSVSAPSYFGGGIQTSASGSTFSGQTTHELQIMGKEIATPANPTAAYNHAYFKTGGHLYTLASGGTEKGLTWGLTTRTAQLFYSGGTAEQVLISGNVPAGALFAGSALRLWAAGNGRSLSGTPGLVGIQIKTGATVIASGNFPLQSNQTGCSWHVTANVVITAAGAPGACNGGFTCTHNFSGAAVTCATTSGTVAVTTTAAVPMQLTWTFGSGHSGNVVVCQNAGIAIDKV